MISKSWMIKAAAKRRRDMSPSFASMRKASKQPGSQMPFETSSKMLANRDGGPWPTKSRQLPRLFGRFLMVRTSLWGDLRLTDARIAVADELIRQEKKNLTLSQGVVGLDTDLPSEPVW